MVQDLGVQGKDSAPAGATGRSERRAVSGQVPQAPSGGREGKQWDRPGEIPAIVPVGSGGWTLVTRVSSANL